MFKKNNNNNILYLIITILIIFLFYVINIFLIKKKLFYKEKINNNYNEYILPKVVYGYWDNLEGNDIIQGHITPTGKKNETNSL